MIVLATKVRIFVRLGPWQPAMLGGLREQALRTTPGGSVTDGRPCLVSHEFMMVYCSAQYQTFQYIVLGSTIQIHSQELTGVVSMFPGSGHKFSMNIPML